MQWKPKMYILPMLPIYSIIPTVILRAKARQDRYHVHLLYLKGFHLKALPTYYTIEDLNLLMMELIVCLGKLAGLGVE